MACICIHIHGWIDIPPVGGNKSPPYWMSICPPQFSTEAKKPPPPTEEGSVALVNKNRTQKHGNIAVRSQVRHTSTTILDRTLRNAGQVVPTVTNSSANCEIRSPSYQRSEKDIAIVISAVHNHEHRLILKLRYLCFGKWTDISAVMGYSLSNVFKMHASALENIQVPDLEKIGKLE